MYRQLPRARRLLPAMAANGGVLTLPVGKDQMAAPVPELMPKMVPLLFDVYTVLSTPATGDGRPLEDGVNEPGVSHTAVPDIMDTPIMPPLLEALG